MDISINLLPRELRAKPFIDPKVLLLIILIGVLAGCCFYFYAMTNSAGNGTEQAKQNTAQYKKDTQTLTNNPELVSLKASIDAMTRAIDAKNAANRHFDSYMASRVLWGDALARVYSYVPLGVTIKALAQSAGDPNSLVVTGTARNYGNLTTYAVQLTQDKRLTLASLPPLSAGTFTLTVGVAPGVPQ